MPEGKRRFGIVPELFHGRAAYGIGDRIGHGRVATQEAEAREQRVRAVEQPELACLPGLEIIDEAGAGGSPTRAGRPESRR